VDLISYTVSGVGRNPTIEETAQGTGDLCGSTFLNRIFEEKLLDKFHGALLVEWKKDYHAAAMRRFETLTKRQFEGRLDKDFKFAARNMKANDSVGISGGNLTITGREMREIFKLVIPKVINLLQAQIRETLKSGKEVQRILLAGGFGQSKYLQDSIKKAIPTITLDPIEHGTTAIVRGAILRAMAEKSPEIPGILSVGGRYSKFNIGALAWVKYDANEHAGYPPGKKKKDDFKGGERVEVMDWLIYKGQLVKEADPTKYPFQWDCKISAKKSREVKIALYKCDDNTPKFFDSHVQKFVDLKANLSGIPEEKFDIVQGKDGNQYYDIDLAVAIACRSGSFKFTLMHEGKPYDTFKQWMN